jgi:hypothetical protein
MANCLGPPSWGHVPIIMNWIDPELEKPVHTKNVQDVVTVSGYRCDLPFFLLLRFFADNYLLIFLSAIYSYHFPTADVKYIPAENQALSCHSLPRRDQLPLTSPQTRSVRAKGKKEDTAC